MSGNTAIFYLFYNFLFGSASLSFRIKKCKKNLHCIKYIPVVRRHTILLRFAALLLGSGLIAIVITRWLYKYYRYLIYLKYRELINIKNNPFPYPEHFI